jgi:hypothetical protein
MDSNYPDVIATLTGKPGIQLDAIQSALGIYPSAAGLGQPFEVLLLLQNDCDQPVEATLSLELPASDRHGKAIRWYAPQTSATVAMQPGESGMFHFPAMVCQAAQPSSGNVLSTRIDVRAPTGYRLLRTPGQMHPGANLAISSVRLNILREVQFVTVTSRPHYLQSAFAILSAEFPPPAKHTLQARYETFWTREQPLREVPTTQPIAKTRTAQSVPETRTNQRRVLDPSQVANSLTRTTVLDPLVMTTEERFSAAGFVLEPAELVYISKTLLYVLEDGLDLEQGFELTKGRWYRQLCLLAAQSELSDDPAELMPRLFDSVVHDGIRLGVHMVRFALSSSPLVADQSDDAADAMLHALNGETRLTLQQVYWPLVLAGLILNARIKLPGEDLWDSLDGLRHAVQQRRSASDNTRKPLFDALDRLSNDADVMLQRLRVARP